MSDAQDQEGAPAGKRLSRRAIVGLAAGVVLLAAGTGFTGWFFTCPCDFTPGGYLLGEEVDEPVTDWSFANDVALCQLQVRAGLLPHSINLNCMATPSGELYLSCSVCAPKRWSAAAEENGWGRIRIGERVYPVSLTRVTDPQEMDRAWDARLEKLQHYDVPGSGTPVGTQRPPEEAWWTFRVASRSTE